MFERFTPEARRVLVLAQEETYRLHHSFIGTEHLLLGLIADDAYASAQVLVTLGFSRDTLRIEVQRRVAPSDNWTFGSPPFTPRSKKALELSLRESLRLGHGYIGTEHLLLGLIDEGLLGLIDEGEGVAAQILEATGGELRDLGQRVFEMLHLGEPPADTDTDSKGSSGQ